MNAKQYSILQYLLLKWGQESGYVSPTEIGMKVGEKPYEKASSWASPTLKLMQKKNWVIRNKRGHYSITGKGRMALERES